VRFGDVHQLINTLGAMTGRGDWVIVAVDAIAENPGSIRIVRATSAALLVVRLGESLLSAARNAIGVVGRERFLGSIVLGGRRRRGDNLFHVTLPGLAFVSMRLLMMS
jgi:hypothetical protein